MPWAHVTDHATQSAWAVAAPEELQKPDLHVHEEMSAPVTAWFELAGQAVQEPVWPAEAYAPLPQGVHEAAAATADDCQ